MVHILNLVVEHGVEAVVKALEEAIEGNQYSLDALQYHLLKDQKKVIPTIRGPEVIPVDLAVYDALLAGGTCE